MLKEYRITFLLLILFACSESDTPFPCESILTSGISFGESYAYTGDSYTISGTKFCKEDLVGILINDILANISFNAALTEISFVIPKLQTDSATLKIQTKSTIIDLGKKIAIFPGSGIWKEMQSFPAPGRSYTQEASMNGKGYVSGGNRYTGYTTTYNYDYYSDLYEYNPVTNSWSLIITDDKLKNKYTATATNGKLFLFPVSPGIGATTFMVSNKSFGTISSYGTESNQVPFTIGNDVYQCTSKDKNMYIKKYDSINDQWNTVKAHSYATELKHVVINFAFAYKGLTYIGCNMLNDGNLDLWSFNPETTELIKNATINIPGIDYPILRHLFTINDLAYFIKAGSSGISPTSSYIEGLANTLYIYNFKLKQWKTVSHTYPETFFNVASFTLNNRGFAGLAMAEASPVFSYSTKFYEFIPE